jgi:uncharacterized membrane protein YecN with MAPEG domain
MQTVALPVVSAITAGGLIIGQMALLILVVLERRKAGQSLGDGGNPGVLAASRRHGNYAENAAIFVTGLALVEMMGADRTFLIAVAALFVAGRIAHAVGLSMPKTINPWRIAGVVATVAAGMTLGVRLVTAGFGHLG